MSCATAGGAASAPPSIHFHAEVTDRRGAEARLINQPPRRFVTWQDGADEARFFISYVSAIDGGAQHVALRRLPDGAFMLASSLNAEQEGRFESLADLLASRRYLDFGAAHDAAAEVEDQGEDEANRSGGGDGGGAGGSRGGGLRYRAAAVAAAAAAAADLGGLSELPARIRPPRARKLGADGQPEPEGEAEREEALDKEWARGIRPVCSPQVFARLFFGFRALALTMFVAVLAAYLRFHSHVHEDVAELREGTQRAVDSATAQLFASLRRVRSGNGGDVGAGASLGSSADGPACEAAVATWAAALSRAAPPLQAAFEAGCAADYIGTLTCVLLVCCAAVLVLMCLHTGRAASNAWSEEARREAVAAGTSDEDFQAELLARARSRREPLFPPGQAAWASTFVPTLGVAVLALVLLVQLLWEAGQISGTVENAARTLSTRNPSQSVDTPHALARRHAPGTTTTAGELDSFAWRLGLWGVASTPLVGASPACLAAVQGAIDPLTTDPPWLRAPLALFVPLVGRVVGAAPPSHRTREAAAASASIAAAAVDGGGDVSSVFAVGDPFAGTPLRGVGALDFSFVGAGGLRRRALVLPSRSGALQLAINLVAFVLFTSVGLLMTQETLIKSSLCRALFCQRGGYWDEEDREAAEFERRMRDVDLGARRGGGGSRARTD